jgi:hypothetical protein
VGEIGNVRRIFVSKPGGKRKLGRSTRRWADNIKMYLREPGREDADWLRTVFCGRLLGSIKCGEFSKQLSAQKNYSASWAVSQNERQVNTWLGDV